jgi:hypothetical protein
MNILEFALWWLKQDDNDNSFAIPIYIIICVMITVFVFLNFPAIIGIVVGCLFSIPPVALIGYVINKEVRDTYNQWLRTRNK